VKITSAPLLCSLLIVSSLLSCAAQPSSDNPPTNPPPPREQAPSVGAFDVRNAPFNAVGDGVTDDRAAIQRAIDAARDAGGGEVYLSAGTYRVTLAPKVEGERALTRAFTIYPKVRIRGASRDTTTIKLADRQGGYGSIFAAQTFGADVSGFELRSLTVDHNTAGNPVTSSADVAIDDVEFSNSKIRAAVWLATGTGMVVQGCRFTDIRAVWTVFMGGNAERVGGITIADNLFEQVGGGNVDFDASQVYTETNGELSRITNNTFTSSNGGQAGLIGLRTAIEVHGDNVLVEGNTSSGFLYGLNVGSGWLARDNTVRGNRFENAIAGVVLWADADAVNPPPDVVMQRIDISSNVVTLDVGGWQGAPLGKDATFAGVILQQQGANDRQLEDVTIQGNDIRFLNIGGMGHENGDRYSAGVHYNRAWNSSDNKLTTRLKILENTITDPPGMGIYVNAPINDGLVQGNTITNPGSSAGAKSWTGWQSGIFVQDRLEHFRVLENRFSGADLKQGIYAINTVIGENRHAGNTVSDSSAPVFVRGTDAGTGDWTTR
jgi:Pectate lyase superfamily protein